MPRLPDPVFGDMLENDSATLSRLEIASVAALGVSSLLLAVAVTFLTGLKFVYGLPGAALQRATGRA